MIILAVDSEPAMLRYLSARLKELIPGSMVLEFTDPMLAVKHFYAHPVDAIFTGIWMKRMDGFELAEAACNRLGDVPVFFVQDSSRIDELVRGAARLLRPKWETPLGDSHLGYTTAAHKRVGSERWYRRRGV